MDIRLMAARVVACKAYPYFAPAILAMNAVEKAGLGTFGVSKRWTMYYDPALLDQWSVKEVAGVLIHETSHLIRNHASRADRVTNVDHNRWNRAGDYEINDGLMDECNEAGAKIALPDFIVNGKKSPCLHPSQKRFPTDLTVEEYYALLSEQEEQDEQPQEDGGVMMGGCGTCAGGACDSEPRDGGDDSSSVGEAAGELIRRDVAARIVQHVKSRGHVPGSWKRWAEEKLTSPVNYHSLIRSAVRNGVTEVSGQFHRTYRRPTRRQSAYGKIIMPSMCAFVPSIAVIIDTSGSMGQPEMSQAVAEVGAILNTSRHRSGVHVLAVDAAVHTSKRVFSASQVELIGGGGTDLRRGFEKFEEMKLKPDLIVVVTDCYTPWPEKAPRAKVVIVKLGLGKAWLPEWKAHVVEVDPAEMAKSTRKRAA